MIKKIMRGTKKKKEKEKRK